MTPPSLVLIHSKSGAGYDWWAYMWEDQTSLHGEMFMSEGAAFAAALEKRSYPEAFTVTVKRS